MISLDLNDKAFRIANYICAGIITVLSGWMIYEVFTTPDLTFSVQWNIFKSLAVWPLYCVGLICALIRWGSMGHWSSTPVVETYENGRLTKVEEDNDIATWLLAQVVFPLIGHFFIEPMIYACLIYYPIVAVAALVGAFLPYVVSALLVAMAVLWFALANVMIKVRFHTIILFVSTLIVAAGLAFGASFLHTHKGHLAEWRAESSVTHTSEGQILPAYYRTRKTVNVRESASSTASKVSQIPAGYTVTVDEIVDGNDGRKWAHVHGRNGKQGWACVDYLEYEEPAKTK